MGVGGEGCGPSTYSDATATDAASIQSAIIKRVALALFGFPVFNASITCACWNLVWIQLRLR